MSGVEDVRPTVDDGARRASRVLIAEDEKHLGTLLEHFLVARGHVVSVVHDGRQALARLRGGGFDVALLDVQMPGLDGLAVLRAVRELPLPPEVIVMTGNGTVDTAIAAMQGGAYDYVAKPYRMAEVDLLVRRATERRDLEREVTASRCASAEDLALVTRYAPLRAVLDLVDRTAARVTTMLIVGEPGTGRTALARRVHAHGAAATRGVFVRVACATLDGGSAAALLTRSLAAAGAGGTLLLHGAERLSTSAQRALLSALEATDAPDAGTPDADVGARCGRPRLIVAAGRPLGAPVDPRLLEHVVAESVVELPPLRDRAGDVAALTESLLRTLGGETPLSVTTAALDRLERHSWPGNVPEFRAVVEAAMARSDHGVVDVDALGLPREPTHVAPIPVAGLAP